MPKETALAVINRKIASLFGGGGSRGVAITRCPVVPTTVFHRDQNTYLPSEQGFQAISPQALEAVLPQIIEYGGRVVQAGTQRSFEAVLGSGGGRIGDFMSLSGGSMVRGHEATFTIIVEGRGR